MLAPITGALPVQAAPVLPKVATAAAPNDQRVHTAALAPIHQLQVLFDPESQDVFIIHANATPPNAETAAKVDSLRKRALAGDKEVLKYSEGGFDERVEAKYAQLTEGAKVENGNLVVQTPIGRYNLGISPDALKTLLRVSMLTSKVAGDRIISVIDEGAQGTHDFYQLRTEDAANPIALLHLHKGDEKEKYKGHLLGRGAEGAVYKALDLACRQVRAVKENVGTGTPDELHQKAKAENSCAQRVNPSNTSPGLADRPLVVFNLHRLGRGGIGLVQRFYAKGDLLHHVVKELEEKQKSPDAKSEISLKEKMNGIYDLLRAVENMSGKDKEVLHLDIKLDNVFVTESNQMVIADFDQVWDMKDQKNLVAKMRALDKKGEVPVPIGSPNCLNIDYRKKMKELCEMIVAKDKDLETLKAADLLTTKPKEKRALEAKLEKATHDLTNLVSSFRAFVEISEVWSVAYLSLQLLVARPATDANEKTVKAHLLALDDKIKSPSGPEHEEERKFLQQMAGLLKLILSAPPPSISTNNKGEHVPFQGGIAADTRARMEAIVDRFSKAFTHAAPRPKEARSRSASIIRE